MKVDDAQLLQAAHDLTLDGDKFTRRHAIILADKFHVGVRRIIKRLSYLGFLYRGAWNWFCHNGGFTQEHYEQARKEITS